jgi:hypothetical protein
MFLIFRMFVGLLALLGATSSSLGLAVGALCPSGDIAMALGPALMVVYVIVGSVGPAGVKDLPNVLKTFRLLSPMKWACEALLSAEFKDRPFEKTQSLHPKKQLEDSRKRKSLSWSRFFVDKAITSSLYIFSLLPSSSYIPKVVDGDIVIQNLGISNSATYKSSSFNLLKLMSIHIALALLGLIASKK